MKKKIFIFDLDYTIISCDSFKIFLYLWFLKNPRVFFFNIWHLVYLYILFNLNIIERGTIKEKFLKIAFKYSSKKDILKFSENFIKILASKYLRKKSKKIINKKNRITILISASPDFYVKKFAKLLNFDFVYSTKISLNKKIGKIIGKNCYGYQKLIIIKKLNLNNKKMYFFTDSKSDMPLIKYCRKTFVIPKTIYDKFYLREYEKLKW